MSLQQVQEALVAASVAALSGMPTEYENVTFTKPTDAKWAKLSFVPNSPSVDTLGENGEDMVDGFLQIDINYPQNAGDSEARSDFEEIRAAFPAGRHYASGDQPVTIRNCGRSQGRFVDQWYRVSTTVFWYAMIPR
jgi:hypothetical protein